MKHTERYELEEEINRLKTRIKRLEKEHDSYVTKTAHFVRVTWSLLHLLGMDEQGIHRYYERMKYERFKDTAA